MRRFILFFFSSRRRHTRCGRDWSSDVCSSDLYIGVDGMNILSVEEISKSYGEKILFDQISFTVLEKQRIDRKSTRLNSSHVRISYAVFCLKKKKKTHKL